MIMTTTTTNNNNNNDNNNTHNHSNNHSGDNNKQGVVQRGQELRLREEEARLQTVRVLPVPVPEDLHRERGHRQDGLQPAGEGLTPLIIVVVVVVAVVVVIIIMMICMYILCIV